jgi:hypothetical protein
MLRLGLVVMAFVGHSGGCASVGPLVRLGAETAMFTAVVAANIAQNEARAERERELQTAAQRPVEGDPIEALIERSRRQLQVGNSCPVSAARAGRFSWTLDACRRHVRCHLLGTHDFTCSDEPDPGEGSAQL